MSTYKAIVSYNGANFFGWQKQNDQITIQGEIEKALIKISKNEEAQVIGCGRTDAGVHATKQVVRITITLDIEASKLERAINSNLPDSISIREVQKIEQDFQPVFDAKEKTYRYIFSQKRRANPFLSEQITFVGKQMELDKLNEACELFIGEHDFIGFSTKGTPVKSTRRNIMSCSVIEDIVSYGAGESEDVYILEITGNGFLKQMVRLIVSAIWSYADGTLSKQDITEQLINPKSEKIAPTAAPNGLYMVNVKY